MVLYLKLSPTDNCNSVIVLKSIFAEIFHPFILFISLISFKILSFLSLLIILTLQSTTTENRRHFFPQINISASQFSGIGVDKCYRVQNYVQVTTRDKYNPKQFLNHIFWIYKLRKSMSCCGLRKIIQDFSGSLHISLKIVHFSIIPTSFDYFT